MAVSARRARTRRIIAVGATVAAIALLGPVAERGAFWNLTLLVMIVLVTWTVAIRRPILRRLFLMASSVVAVLTIVEVALRELRAPPPPLPAFPAVRVLPDVGLCPAPSHTTPSKLVIDHKTVFDVRYTMDKDGLRITPEANASPEATLLCFGCSFTFGYGVEDNEAWPYRVGTLSKERVKAYNFAFHAWGPHQMLAMLESGRVARSVDPKGKVVGVFLVISRHVARAAGLAPFATTGPRYVLDGDGVRRDGMLVDRFRMLRWFPTIRKSEIYKRTVLSGSPGPEDEELFAKIVQAAKDRFETTYPGGRFHVLLWPNERTKQLAPVLRRHRLDSRVMVLPPGRHTLPGDLHPNARAYDAVAAFVLREIMD